MSWAYRGWIGSVYAAGVSEKLLSAYGLTAYAQHPLLRAVEIDRSYYDPLPATEYGAHAAPFDRIVDEDPENRESIATLVTKALGHAVPTTVLVDNKAEGSSPESILRLAKLIAYLLP